MKYPSKRDLPVANPYAKAKPSLEEYLKQKEESKDPVLEYALEDYDIKKLDNIPFREEVQEINLWTNQIENPAEITKVLMKLPNLKALWLNDNPV